MPDNSEHNPALAESHLMLAIRHLNYFVEAAGTNGNRTIMVPGVVQLLRDIWVDRYSGIPSQEAAVVVEAPAPPPAPADGRSRYRDPVPAAAFDIETEEQPRRGRQPAAEQYGVPLCQRCKMAVPCNCDIVCSYCQARQGQPCRSNYGTVRDLPHAPRKMRIIGGAVEGSQAGTPEGACEKCGMMTPCFCEFTCERCGAEPTDPCTTAAGNNAYLPHASRRHQGNAP